MSPQELRSSIFAFSRALQIGLSACTPLLVGILTESFGYTIAGDDDAVLNTGTVSLCPYSTDCPNICWFPTLSAYVTSPPDFSSHSTLEVLLISMYTKLYCVLYQILMTGAALAKTLPRLRTPCSSSSCRRGASLRWRMSSCSSRGTTL
jgi:hypothetical protein